MVDRVVGIDPGLKGGLVVVDAAGRFVAAMKMPTYAVKKKSGGARSFVCASSVAAFLREHGVTKAVVEDVYSRKGEGHMGAFSFGEGKGALRGVLAALDIPVRWVSPQAWKGVWGLIQNTLPGESDAQRQRRGKKAAIARAQTLFPKAALMKHEGCAEAALMAAGSLVRPV